MSVTPETDELRRLLDMLVEETRLSLGVEEAYDRLGFVEVPGKSIR